MIPSENRVLIVDDDDATRIYLARQLRQFAETVVTVEDGQQALQRLKEQPFDLVLLDILMPGISGLAVLKTIKADDRLTHLPVVMVSSLDDLDSLVQCIELGAEDYLFKPLNPVLLSARINACLERKHLRDQEQAYLEQLKAEKEEAESANRAKSAFLANISHELRTPLNAIIGYSEILQEDLRDSNLESFIPDLERIRSSGRGLLNIINNILDISRMEAGGTELSLEHFGIRSLIEHVTAAVQTEVQAGANTLQTFCPEDMGTMHADLNKVRQILLHLLSNATKFTRNGTIELRVWRESNASLKPEADRAEMDVPLNKAGTLPDAVIFQITDTGIGIPLSDQAELFQVFHQIDSSSTRKHGGTGLGLALSQRFCQAMGGTIAVESSPESGSRFTVRLPADVVDHHAATALPSSEPGDGFSETAPQPPLPSSNLTEQANLVLVVDGNPDVRDRLVETLNDSGYRVVTTWSNREGLRLARELRPDLIITGLLSPTVDGWSLLATLKADATLATVPVVLAAVRAEGAVATAQNLDVTLGVAEYLTEPADFKRIALLLRQYRSNSANASFLKGRVLLLQKDGATRQVVQRLLEKDGWHVEVAEEPQSALALAEAFPPDFFLLDLMPPDLKGLHFLSDLRQQASNRSTPVMLMTTQEFSRDDRLWLNTYLETLFCPHHSARTSALEALNQLVAACTSPKAVRLSGSSSPLVASAAHHREDPASHVCRE